MTPHTNASLARKLKALEKKYDEQFRVVFEAIYQLMDASEKKGKRQIAFKREDLTDKGSALDKRHSRVV